MKEKETVELIVLEPHKFRKWIWKREDIHICRVGEQKSLSGLNFGTSGWGCQPRASYFRQTDLIHCQSLVPRPVATQPWLEVQQCSNSMTLLPSFLLLPPCVQWLHVRCMFMRSPEAGSQMQFHWTLCLMAELWIMIRWRENRRGLAGAGGNEKKTCPNDYNLPGCLQFNFVGLFNQTWMAVFKNINPKPFWLPFSTQSSFLFNLRGTKANRVQRKGERGRKGSKLPVTF